MNASSTIAKLLGVIVRGGDGASLSAPFQVELTGIRYQRVGWIWTPWPPHVWYCSAHPLGMT